MCEVFVSEVFLGSHFHPENIRRNVQLLSAGEEVLQM